MKTRSVQVPRPDSPEEMADVLMSLLTREEFYGLEVRSKGPIMLRVADGPDALLDLKRSQTLLETLDTCTMQEIDAEGWSGPEIWASALSFLQITSHRCLGFICGDLERVLGLMGSDHIQVHHCQSTVPDGQYHLFGVEGVQDPELPSDRLIFIGAPMTAQHLSYADVALIYLL